MRTRAPLRAVLAASVLLPASLLAPVGVSAQTRRDANGQGTATAESLTGRAGDAE